MTSLRAALGRRIIARDTAEEIGRLRHLVIGRNAMIEAITSDDLPGLALTSPPMPSMALAAAPREAPPAPPIILDWDAIVGFGPDAIVASSASSLRQPATDQERRAAGGDQELLDRPLLSEGGDLLGTIDDVEFDERTGEILMLSIRDRSVKLERIAAIGPYAVIATVT